METRRQAATRVAYVVTCVALLVWGLHWLWGPELPPGVDATGHLTRLEVGLEWFSSLRLDGWFDRAMLGYQTFLVYGPGLAFAVAAVRLLTLGLVSIPGAYEIVGILGLAALVPTAAALTRSFGLTVTAGRVAGILALAVSSGRGGGIEGTFDLGLMPNTVAAPLVLWAWALMVDRRPRPVLLGAVVAAVAITHPQSLVVLVGFAPLVLAAGWACGVVGSGHRERLVRGAVVSVGLSAWWWIPAVLHRDLRGLLTSWDLPTFWDHIRLVVEGDRGWIGPTALVVVAAWAVAAVQGLVRRDRGELALAALPLVALAGLHLAESLLHERFPEVVLLPNRGLTYAAYLAVPVVGLVVDRLLGRLGPLPWIAAAGVVAITLPSLAAPPWVLDEPTPAMRAAASTLAASVGDGDRFAFIYSTDDHTGVPASGRWLGWTSGAHDIGPFGAEYAPGVGLTLLVFEPPEDSDVAEWVERVRALAVTHLVTASPATEGVIERSGLAEEVGRRDDVVVWRITAPPLFTMVEAEREHLVIDVDFTLERRLPLPVGWSPGWRATVDDQPVALHRTPDGRLSVDLDEGPHRIALDFELPSGHLLGVLATAGFVVGMVISSRARRRREPDRRSPEPPPASRSAGSPDPR